MTDHVLYRMFDADGTLLYVGLTNNPRNRLHDHQSSKGWWDEVSNIRVQTYGSRDDLERAEREAIISERPRHNVTHNRAIHLAPRSAAGSPAGTADVDEPRRFSLLTIAEAAEELQTCKATVYRLFQRGQLSWVQVGAHRRVTADELARFIAENTRGAA